MSAFQTGSFDAVVDKGTSFTQYLSYYYNRKPGANIFWCAVSRNSGLSFGEFFKLYCRNSLIDLILMVKLSLQCGHNSRENAVKMLEEVERYTGTTASFHIYFSCCRVTFSFMICSYIEAVDDKL